MFEFNLLEKEKITMISNEGLLQIADEYEEVSVIITNQRFLILKNPKDIEKFRIGRMIDTFKSSILELIFETPLENIDDIITNDDFDKYILKDTNYFYLKDNSIKKFLLTKLKNNLKD